MNLTPEEFYEEYMRVLDDGDLNQMDALIEAETTNDEYFQMARKACVDYERKHGIEPTEEERKRSVLALRTVMRRVWNGQKVRTRFKDKPD